MQLWPLLRLCLLLLTPGQALLIQPGGGGRIQTVFAEGSHLLDNAIVQGDTKQHLSSCLSVGGATLVAAIALVCLQDHTRKCIVQQAARSVYLLLMFVLVINYTIVILDSYDLSVALGLSEAASGRLVGTYNLGACAGAAGMWLLLRSRPHLWSQSPRSALVLGLSSQLAGSLLFSGATAAVTFELGNPDGREGLGLLLMVSRFISGIGLGACQQFLVTCMFHITPVQDRPEHTVRWYFSGIVGLGLGPPVAAALQMLNFGEPDLRFDFVGYVQVVFVLTAFYAVVHLHPELDGVKDCLEPNEQELPGNPTVVMGCLTMTGLRSFSVSAMEVAIVLFLEKTYGWDQRLTGFVVGAVFLCCIPLRWLYLSCSKRMIVHNWIRLFAALSLLGSLLLSASICRLLGVDPSSNRSAAVLLAGCLLLFPSLLLSDALASGLMHQHVLPEGSLLDANHSQLWFMLIQGLGRYLGPWLARLTLDTCGQDAFSALQGAASTLDSHRALLKAGGIYDNLNRMSGTL